MIHYVMKQLGEMYGVHTLLRYDPERSKNNFTIIIGKRRLYDTDDPGKALQEFLKQIENGERDLKKFTQSP